MSSRAINVENRLIAGYIIYTFKTFRGNSSELEYTGGMYFWKMLNRINPSTLNRPPLYIIIFQIFVALITMTKGAHTFVHSLEQIALSLDMDPLLFALLLAPVATELPEKFNSVTWTWKGRDTLAMGNLTGAMVFQSTFPVSVGLIFTDWHITGMAMFAAMLSIVSTLILLCSIIIRKKVSPLVVLFGGFLYLIYAALLVFR